MQTLFVLLLICVLVSCLAAMAAMGVMQCKRSNRLARKAYDRQLHFAMIDPFDIPRRYEGFALVSCGHSSLAHNITHGHVGGCPIRAFDFRYEVAHATRRVARHYIAVVAETDNALPRLVMWHEQDHAAMPLTHIGRSVRMGSWYCIGQGDVLTGLVGRLEKLFGDGVVNVETRGASLMICSPVTAPKQDYCDILVMLPELLELFLAHGAGNLRADEANHARLADSAAPADR